MIKANEIKKKTGKKIPIQDAKNIAINRGYSQVIIHGYDDITGIQHVTTYGKSESDCENAAKGGNVIKKFLGFPDSACNSKPSRQIKREKLGAKIKAKDDILLMLIQAIDNPYSDDTLNLAKFTAIGTLAKNNLHNL